ncbi:hypothetical protein ACTXT7_016493 [Hymenolepis weldensis]
MDALNKDLDAGLVLCLLGCEWSLLKPQFRRIELPPAILSKRISATRFEVKKEAPYSEQMFQMPSATHPLRQEDQFCQVGNQTNIYKAQPQGSVSNPLQASFSQTCGAFDHGVIKVEFIISVNIEHHPPVNQCWSTSNPVQCSTQSPCPPTEKLNQAIKEASKCNTIGDQVPPSFTSLPQTNQPSNPIKVDKFHETTRGSLNSSKSDGQGPTPNTSLPQTNTLSIPVPSDRWNQTRKVSNYNESDGQDPGLYATFEPKYRHLSGRRIQGPPRRVHSSVAHVAPSIPPSHCVTGFRIVPGPGIYQSCSSFNHRLHNYPSYAPFYWIPTPFY